MTWYFPLWYEQWWRWWWFFFSFWSEDWYVWSEDWSDWFEGWWEVFELLIRSDELEDLTDGLPIENQLDIYYF